MFTFFHAFILGIVEGITEFLPISSTGHLILTSQLLRIPQTDFLKSFEIAIQLGAILAVVMLYWKKLLLDKIMISKLLVAFLPTALVVLGLYKIIKQNLLGNSWVVLGSLVVGGSVLIIFELLYKEKSERPESVENVSYRNSFLIGLAQSIALIPGVSRSAATIICGMLLGYKRKTVVEFSFLLAVPTMAAATGYDMLKSYEVFTPNNIGVLVIGFITSFITAFFAIKFLLKFIEKNTFIVFGVYRIVIAVLLFFVLW
jgi:undecaprenyl-diphosphatase